jgi:hypothetical protein
VKAKEIDTSVERQIVTYAITSTRFLRDVGSALRPENLKSAYARTVVKWVLEYYTEYHEAPGKHIQELYQKNFTQVRDEDETELISEFLVRLSDRYKNETISPEKDNIEFIVTNATTYLRLQKLERLKESIELAVLNKDPTKGEQEVGSFQRVGTIRDKGVSIFDDTVAVTTAFLEEEDVLFRFPGILGDELGPFVRGDLVSYMAASKRGKSWWEWYTGQIAAYYGYHVVFFNLEMTPNQIIRRAWTSLTGVPRRRKAGQAKRIISVPYFDSENEDGPWTVEEAKKEYKTIDLSSVRLKQKNFRRQFHSGNVRIFSLPAYSATLKDIVAHLDNLYYYDDYVPDVVVVDYADLLVPSNARVETRHQLDEIWKGLRRIGQERNCLVVTASQAGRAAFDADATEKDISEDIRKIAHVAKLVSINQTRPERDIGVCRLRQLVERDDRMGGGKVVVLQCLDLGQVCLDSRLQEDVILPTSPGSKS